MFVLSGCSKEKKLERSLHKKDGTWTIDQLDYEIVDQDFNNSTQQIFTGVANNVGSVTFDKEGGGSFNYSVEGYTRTLSFSWSVSDETITLSRISQSISGAITQIVVAYTGTEIDNDRIEIAGSETEQGIDGQFVIAGTMQLSK